MPDEDASKDELKPEPRGELTQPLGQQSLPKTMEELTPKSAGVPNEQTPFPRIVELKSITIFSALTAYAFAVALLYLYAFWKTFDINILDFIQTSDILKLTIFPVLFGAFFTFIGLATLPLLFPAEINLSPSDIDKMRNELEQADTPEKREALLKKAESILVKLNRLAIVAKWQQKWGKALSIIWIVSVFIIIVIVPEPYRWQIGAMAVGFTVFINVPNVQYLERLIPHLVWRLVVMEVAVVVPFLSFGYGKKDAINILSGNEYKVVSTKVFKDGVKELGGQTSLKYIGVAGDNFFFISMDNSKTYIVKDSDLYFLELTRITKIKPIHIDVSIPNFLNFHFGNASPSPSPSPALPSPTAKPANTGT